MEIAKCPYCNSSKVKVMRFRRPPHPDLRAVSCRDCFSRGQVFTLEQDAIEAWNRVSRAVNNSPDKCSE